MVVDTVGLIYSDNDNGVAQSRKSRVGSCATGGQAQEHEGNGAGKLTFQSVYAKQKKGLKTTDLHHG